jgi:hypothetical protein
MGIETWGCNAVEISAEDIKKVLPDYDIESLSERMSGEVSGEQTYDSSIEDCFLDDETDEGNELLAEYRRFQELFLGVTGIHIYCGHHDQDSSGNRGDEVDGMFWHLDYDDIYTETSAAKALRDKGVDLAWRNYTIWG